MFSLTTTILIEVTVVMLIMTLLWTIATTRQNVTIIDVFWGLGFVFIAWTTLWMHWPVGLRVVLLTSLTTVWGLRLTLYLLWRNWGLREDRRYAAMRKTHGPHFWWVSLFTVFLLQAVILWFVSLPLQIAAAVDRNTPLNWLDAAGIMLWGVGFLFEAVGDWQLARFKSDPCNAGKVLDSGLWRYTRHPNYFGDFCVWWGIYLISASSGASWTIASPLLMSLLLMKISGVNLLEANIANRHSEYAKYQARTNAFFPGFSKSSCEQPVKNRL